MDNAIIHFRLRASSWFMAIVSLAIGVVMTINPDGMTDNPGSAIYLAYVNRLGPPEMWRALFLLIGTLRLAALIVNGSFKRVWWTPHIRMVASGVSSIVWLQFTMSVWATSYPAIATVVFPGLMFLEAYNTAVAAYETTQRPEDDFGQQGSG